MAREAREEKEMKLASAREDKSLDQGKDQLSNCHQAVQSLRWPHQSGPPACDSTSNRKATYRHRPSSTTRSVSLSPPGTTRLGIVFRVRGSWRCKPACIATPSARCTASSKPMGWWKRWQVLGSTSAINRSHGKSERRPISATVASPISIERCASAWMACSTRVAPCSKPENCSPVKSIGACAAAPGC